MINKSLSQARIGHLSPATAAILLSLSVYLLWTIATYLLEGRLNLLQEPTVGGRYVYVLVANVLIGTVGAIWALRWLLASQIVTAAQVGFRSLRRMLVAAVIGAVLGFGLLLQSQPASLDPLVLFNGFAQVLPVSIAEVVVCWAVIGGSFEAWAKSKGKVIGKLGQLEEIAYKTTLLGGRWEVGERGIWMFGALWVVPAVGFIVAAVAILAGWSWWQPVLIGVTLFSLLLTVLDWRVAYAGVVVNLVILAVLALEPRIASWFLG